jgi:hypothetical protein
MIDNVFDVLALLVKLLPGPDFLLDLRSPGISLLAIYIGALIDNAMENVGACQGKVLDAVSWQAASAEKMAAHIGCQCY